MYYFRWQSFESHDIYEVRVKCNNAMIVPLCKCPDFIVRSIRQTGLGYMRTAGKNARKQFYNFIRDILIEQECHDAILSTCSLSAAKDKAALMWSSVNSG
mgnify:CR=1 FL=1